MWGSPHRAARGSQVELERPRTRFRPAPRLFYRAPRRRTEVPANCGQRGNDEEPQRMEATPNMGLAEDIHAGRALTIRRAFTSPGVHPFDTVEWELRDARIGHGGKVAFEQPGVEFPRSWSQNATNIVSQKYFRGQLDAPSRER